MEAVGSSGNNQAMVVVGSSGPDEAMVVPKHKRKSRGKEKASGSKAPRRRRGRPMLARTIRGSPSNLYSIVVRIGGFWLKENKGSGLIFKGGVVRYIHNVDPKSFSIAQLFLAVMKMQLSDNTYSRYWWHDHGAEYPFGLHTIEEDDHLDEMWLDVEIHGKRGAMIFVQMSNYIKGAYKNGDDYLLPAEVPDVGDDYNEDFIYQEAENGRQNEQRRSPFQNWEKEKAGNAWYVSSESVGRVVGS